MSVSSPMASEERKASAVVEDFENHSLLEEGDTADGDRTPTSSPLPLSKPSLRLLLLVLSVSLPLLLILVLMRSSVNGKLSDGLSSLPSDGASVTEVPFQPPPIVSDCLCSSMYKWSTPFKRPSKFTNRLPWHLSRSHSYDEWEGCPMWANRSVLVHQAPALPGPAINRDDSADDIDIWQLPPCLLFEIWLRGPDSSYRTPVFSLQYTLFDQEDHVLTNLYALLVNAEKEETFELVVVFDDCTDGTIPLAHALLHSIAVGCGIEVEGGKWIEEQLPSMTWKDVTLPPEFDASLACINPALVHIRTLIQPTSLWETAANNLGARAAYPSAEVLVFIQDDILIQMEGWNAVLALPTRLYADVAGVTGRCAHPRYSASPSSLPGLNEVGRCGRDINDPLTLDTDHRCVFYVRDTVNRGPLLIVHDVFREMGYFDEVHFHMDDSDHDLFARLYDQTRQVAGFMPIDTVAPLAHGASRRSHPAKPESSQAYLQARTQREQNSRSGLSRISDEQGPHWSSHDEDRRLAGHFQRCLRHFRSKGKQEGKVEEPHWWKPLPRWIEGGEDARHSRRP